jgi:hypothetical protein
VSEVLAGLLHSERGGLLIKRRNANSSVEFWFLVFLNFRVLMCCSLYYLFCPLHCERKNGDETECRIRYSRHSNIGIGVSVALFGDSEPQEHESTRPDTRTSLWSVFFEWRLL